MKTLTIQLPDETAQQVEEAANGLGISTQTLVETSVVEKLERLAIDLDTAAQHVLEKNAELYRRLA